VKRIGGPPEFPLPVIGLPRTPGLRGNCDLSDHLTNTQIEGYGRCLLPAREALSVSDHLVGCEMCRQRLESSANDDKEYLALRAELLDRGEGLTSPREHLTVEQLTWFVDGTLPGEELQVVEDHLTCCEECNLMVKDLLAFKDQVISGFDCNHHPSRFRAQDESRWRRLSSAWPRLWPESLVFGTALAACLLAVMSWLVWREWREGNANPEITKVSPLSGVSTSGSPNPAQGGESSLIVRLSDGEGEVTLDRDGVLSGLARLSPEGRKMVERALTTQSIERSPLLSELTRLDGKSRGGGNRGEEFSVIEPVGEVTVTDRPTFRWTPLNGATNYTVEVYDESLRQVAGSQPVTGHTWTVTQPLKRGRIYAWLVKTSKNGRVEVSPPAQEARFRVLDRTRLEELSAARRDYGSSHLALGLLYMQAGVLDEAEREFTTLQGANPKSEIVNRFLMRIRKMRDR
jgi:putative zinc finger protein